MFKAALNTLLATTIGATALNLVAHVEPAQAFRVTYDFTVSVPSGVYAGNHQGRFSFDASSLIGKGREIVSPSANGLTVLFNLAGRIYMEDDDSDFFETFDDQFPKVSFQDGVLLGLSYLVLPPADPGFLIVAPGSTFSGSTIAPGFYEGTTRYSLGTRVADVRYSLVSGNSAAVPEPSEIAGSMLALGLLGIGLKLRQRGKSTPNTERAN